jgi:hypothetical protein
LSVRYGEMVDRLEVLLARNIKWNATGDAEHPYRCDIDGAHYVVRVNDFPAEPLYSIVADGVTLGDIDDWPLTWRRPDRP